MAYLTELARRAQAKRTSLVRRSVRFSAGLSDLEYLRTVVVSPLERERIIAALNTTRKQRIEILKDRDTDIRQQFPWFFMDLSLVSMIHVL